MNFFFLDEDPKTNAYSLCNQHRCRMIYESLQLLCNAYDGIEREALSDIIYKPGYVKHPCSIWTKKSIANWKHLHTYTGFLFESYFSYGGKAYQEGYKLWNVMFKILPNIPEIFILTPPYLAFGSSNPRLNFHIKEYQRQVGTWNSDLKLYQVPTLKKAVEAYRGYYNRKQFKNGKPKWTKNTIPEWYKFIDVLAQ